jgi:hypothetical protein
VPAFRNVEAPVIRFLSSEEALRLVNASDPEAQEVTQLLAAALEAPKPLSIRDLKGLGKEHWRGVDAAKHVAKERAAWD